MEPRIQSSFIPKNPISLENKPHRRHRPAGLFFVLSLIALLVTGALWGGLFLYKGYLQTGIESKSAALEQTRAQFAPAAVQEMKRLDTRINTAEKLVGAHLAPSLFLAILERTTLRTVQFTDVTYTVLADGNVAVTGKGVGNSFASVALQHDALTRDPAILFPMIEKPKLNDEGGVTFEFTAQIDTSALRYANLVNPAPSEPVMPASGSGATSTEAGNDTGSSTPVEETASP